MNENEVLEEVFEPEAEVQAETEDTTEPSELELLRGEVERLKGELAGCCEREKSNARIISECSDFHKYFPETSLESIPDEVWESVKGGIPLSHSYALYEKKLSLARAQAESVNERNREMSSGAVTSANEEHYFSPSEVKKMTREQVRKNYSDIIESMRHWN